jgi:hypothetical protein
VGLLDELRSEEPPPKHLCGVTKTVESLDKKDAADLVAAIEDATIMATSISRVLARRGLTLKPDAIRRHRKRECRCA